MKIQLLVGTSDTGLWYRVRLRRRGEADSIVSFVSPEATFQRARSGEADIVISHYGKKEVERIVLEEYGSWPKMVFASQRESKLEILVSSDPLLQRIMAAVIVNPQKVESVNVEGATALRDYLLSPKVQARIAAFRSPWSDKQLWWPAGRDN